MKLKKKSQLQEKSVAKDLNAKTVVASGALWGSKGDVRHDNLLVECKTTEKPFYSLSMQIWEKIEKEAIKDGLRVPVMCIDLNNGKDRYAVFLRKDFHHYKRFYEIYKRLDTSWSDKKSFRVQSPCSCLMIRYEYKGTHKNPHFVVTPWSDFLYMLKGEEVVE